MASGDALRVEGLKELRREVKKAAGADGRKALTKANKAAGQVILPAVKSEAPKVTGRIAKSAKVNASATKSVISIGGARAPHAGPIFGGWTAGAMSAALSRSTSAYWRKVGKAGVRGIAPNDFVGEAIRSQMPAVRDQYEAAIHALVAALASGD